jgi:hypothetical protein
MRKQLACRAKSKGSAEVRAPGDQLALSTAIVSPLSEATVCVRCRIASGRARCWHAHAGRLFAGLGGAGYSPVGCQAFMAAQVSMYS